MVESYPLPEGTIRIPAEQAHAFARAAVGAAGLSPEHAEMVATVLVSADMRGIRSHGLSRLGYFLPRIENGVINPDPQMQLTKGSETTAALDADHGVGIVASNRAMAVAIEMAEQYGSGFVAVSNSSHFGYAGYWAAHAAARGFVGIAMSSSGQRSTPTFGDESLLGTNPVSVAIPGGAGGTDFLLDMATTAVAVGKIETALREGRLVEPGWVSATAGEPGLDDKGILTYDAPLLPLGGAGTEGGGHKGYGLALTVELLCGALAGSSLAARIAGNAARGRSAMGHFFGALRISGFRDPAAMQADMEATFDVLRGAVKAPGQDRVYIHGEPETIAEEENRRLGIPVTPHLLELLRSTDERFDLGFEWLWG